MSNYWNTMFNVTLPIVFACFLGLVLHKKRGIQSKSLADLCLYALSPCLIVIALAESKSQVSMIWPIALFTIVHTILCWLLSIGASKLCSFSQKTEASLSLTTIIGNSNNYGLPILLLAYGSEGFSIGAAYVIGQIILVNTLGLYIASRSKVNPKQALLQIMRTPLIYACILGILIFMLHVQLPSGISNSLKLFGTAYPAIALIILGIQFGVFQFQGLKRKEVLMAILFRVILVPLLAEMTILLLGIKGLVASILLVQSSMPAGINTIFLTERYDGDRELVAITVSVTTLLSFITLPFLISVSR